MLSPVIQTKLTIPFIPPSSISRPQLIKQLDQGLQLGHRLLLVTAPPGYGKTTLLSAWTNQNAARFSWLTLDESDNDPVQFWSDLTNALEKYTLGLCEPVQTLLQNNPLHQLPSDLLLAVVINRLAQENTPLVLVLDDYHVIQNERIHTALVNLLARIPVNFHIALTSRTEPPLQLTRLRARGQLTEIHMAALSFSEREATDFLNQSMHLELTGEEAALLNQRTEGWIAGLQLAGLTLHSLGKEKAAHFIRSFGGGHRHIMDYLTDEVLQYQSEQIQTFLLQTSLLERLSAPLCEAVTSLKNTQAILESLERSNLFIIPLDSERQWYRYHPLWAEMLQTRLKREQPEQVSQLHRRAADWFARNNFLDEAIAHALSAGEAEQAADLLESIAKGLVLRGGGATLQTHLEKLPQDIIRVRPTLLIAQAWALVMDGYLDEATSILDEMSLRGGLSPTQLGEIAAVRAIIATIHQDIPAIQQYADTALRLIPLEDSQLRCVVLLSQGTAAVLSGAIEQSIRLLEQAIQESMRGHQPIIYLVAVSTLAQTYEALGNFNEAERLHRQVIALETDSALGGLPLIGVGYVGLGGILHEHLYFDEAESALQKGLAIGQRWGSPEIQIGAYFSLARLRYTQGRVEEAFTILEKLESDFASAMPIHERGHIQAMKVRFRLAQGQMAQAKAWARGLAPVAYEPILFGDEIQFLVLTRIWQASEETASAQKLLDHLEGMARSGGRNSLIEVLLLKTLAKASSQKEREQYLQEALSLVEPQNQRRVFVDEPELLPLLQTYHSGHPENKFVINLLADFERRAAAMQKPPTLLSEREMDVLRLMAMGLSNQEIADRLVVALSTVKSHVKSILMKLGAENRTAAVTRAQELGLLEERP